MATKIYGASDDLVEFEGDVLGEVNFYGSEKGLLIVCSDATLLEAKYGKDDEAIWEIKVKHKGQMFERIEHCEAHDAEPHSDVVYMKDGLKWAYVADEWEKVK